MMQPWRDATAAAAAILKSLSDPKRSVSRSRILAQLPHADELIAAFIAAGLVGRNDSAGDRLVVPTAAAHRVIQSLALYCEEAPESAGDVLADLPAYVGWTIGDLFRMETRRVIAARAAGVDPTPLRRQASALIIVKSRQDGDDVYLLAQRRGWRGYGLIGGKFNTHTDRSLQDTANRELVEELHLSRGEFRAQPQLEAPIVVKAVSSRLGVLTAYHFELFQMLSGRPLVPGRKFAWFGREAVRQGVTANGDSLNHLAYPEIQRALWHDLSGGLDGLPLSIPPLDSPE